MNPTYEMHVRANIGERAVPSADIFRSEIQFHPYAENFQSEFFNNAQRNGHERISYQYAEEIGNERSSLNYLMSRTNIERNILMELKQEHEILKGFNIDVGTKIKAKATKKESEASSSVQSKKHKRAKMDRLQELEQVKESHKKLEMAFIKSVSRIQQLLAKEINFKKTIGELRTQIIGKGGINSLHEEDLKAHQKTIEDLNIQLSRAQQQIRSFEKIKTQFIIKIESLQKVVEEKEKREKGEFLEQRKLYDEIRNQKEKHLNAQILCRSIQMQLDMLTKEKNSEMSILTKQLQSYKSHAEVKISKQSEIQRHLTAKLQQKQTHIISLMTQVSNYASKSKQIESNFARSQKIQAEGSYTQKIAKLEQTIARQIREKQIAVEDVRRLKSLLAQAERRAQHTQETTKQLRKKQKSLQEEIVRLEDLQAEIDQNTSNNGGMKSQMQNLGIEQRMSPLFEEPTHKNQEQNGNHEDEIRLYRRKLEDAEFAIETARKNGDLNETLARKEKHAQIKNMLADFDRYKKTVVDNERIAASRLQEITNKLKAKDNEIMEIKRVKEQVEAKCKSQIEAINERLTIISTTNEHFLQEREKYEQMNRELTQLRRQFKKFKSSSESVQHLWRVKEVEFGNIVGILREVSQ